jgi:hypothetical protein
MVATNTSAVGGARTLRSAADRTRQMRWLETLAQRMGGGERDDNSTRCISVIVARISDP